MSFCNGCGKIGGVSVAEQPLQPWVLSQDAWRLSRFAHVRYLDMFLRIFSANRLPKEFMGRLYTLGIPDEMVNATLKSIRHLDEWSAEWVETAQQYLGVYRRETSARNHVEAEKARKLAAMCYQAAQILEIQDAKTRHNCRAWAANLYRLSLPVTNPNARHFTIPWRDQELPVIFQVPEQSDGPFGLVILLNGVSLSKEETFNWSPRFLQAGYAVMAVDSPGTGEATSLGPFKAHYTDILDGVLALLKHESIIDLNRIALLGASLGGNEAIRIACRNPELMAVIAITPAAAPSEWIHHASPLLLAELAGTAGDDPTDTIQQFDVLDAVKDLAQPVLVFGAGRDMIVPANESQRLVAALGAQSTYVWYPSLGHCLYVAADQWSSEAAAWLQAVDDARREGITDVAQQAAGGLRAIENHAYRTIEATYDGWDDDEIGEYARLITDSDD